MNWCVGIGNNSDLIFMQLKYVLPFTNVRPSFYYYSTKIL